MKIPDLKISTQLTIGFGVILLVVMLLGVVAFVQTSDLASQTQDIYEHPLQVQRAVGELKADILSIRIGMETLILTNDPKEIAATISSMDVYQQNAFDQINILFSRYLGPQSDVELVKQEFIRWNTIRTETLRLLREGSLSEAAARTQSTGVGGAQVETVLTALKSIDIFAMNKGEELYANAQQLKSTLNQQLFVLVGVGLLLALVMVYFLLRNIRTPLAELTHATQAFKNGDMHVRSKYSLKNEFGELSDAYNELAEAIQQNVDLKNKTTGLADVMLSVNDARQFFQTTLQTLAEHTGSPMAAVYLLSSDQKSFEHYLSIGLDEKSQASFSAELLEGQFGSALLTRQIRHITHIAEDTHFTFNTVSGKFIPRAIITIPVISDSRAVAVISLAALSPYSQPALQFVQEIWPTLNARVTGILAFRQIQTLVEHLEHQNCELDAQKTEMSAQTEVLNQQNIELEVQKKQLGESNRLKTSFISNMSHELRTPLNSVIALSGVLSRRLAHQIPEEEYSYLEVIERNGKQLLNLINEILDLSRIEAGREEIDLTQFDMNRQVAEVVALIRPLAEQKSIDLMYHPNPGLSPLTSDPAKCRHILQNLVGNAVKFTEAGRVEVAMYQSINSIYITVSDTGIGIAKDQLPLIFDEFKQADSSTSRRYGGSGLGLAIAKKYAELLGGTISVKSAIGEGSVFTLSLPLRVEAKKSTPPVEVDWTPASNIKPTLPISPADPAHPTILLVEDSEPAIIQLKDILEEHAYHILVARNGEEALELIQHSLPDAIILDLTMPGMDGFEVLKTVRDAERTAHLPVLILTARQISKDELKFLKRNNVHQLIQKGDINRRELLNAVAGMVSAPTAKAEKPQPVPQVISGKPLVLVVEDNPDNMLTARALLSGEFTVIEATDGLAAIQQARQYQPHLILMDIALPEMDGVEAFKIIRSDTHLQNIPVIALTASAMTTDREAILAYGFDAYIPKPIDHKEFKQIIQQVLYGKE